MRLKSRIFLLAAVGLLAALPATLPVAREAGRDYPRCIHGCNVARQNCEGRCDADCAALYPNSASQRRACVSACHDICVSQEQDCKDRCLAIKKGDVSPLEP